MSSMIPNSGTTLEPLMYKIDEAVTILRMSRAEIYKQIRAGRIKTVKQGRATFITRQALENYVELLMSEATETDAA